MNLPPLPEKVIVDRHTPTGIVTYGWKPEQMQAYGQACRDAALEEAAQYFDRQFELTKDSHNYWQCAAIDIRNLK